MRVRETVPDSVFDRADAIELVDLTPDDLIQRLKEGKVYVPQPGRARARAFLLARQPHGAARARAAPHRRAGRRAAAHPDAGARDPGPVGGGRAHPGLRQRGPARRRAGALRQAPAPTGCTRRGPRSTSRAGAACSSPRRSATASPTRCGSPSGSAARRSPSRAGAPRIADDVLGYAHDEQRHPDRHRQVDALALVRDPARLGRARPGAPLRQHQRPRHRRRRARRRADAEEDRARPRSRRSRSIRGPTAVALLAVAVALGVGDADPAAGSGSRTSISSSSPRSSASPCATACGRRCSPACAPRSCYNFFFLPPIYTFTIADPTNVAAFVFFIVVALIVSNVAARGAHRRRWPRRRRARTTESLYAFSRKLAGVGTLDDVLWATRLPDRADAQGAGRAAAAGGRLDRRQGRLSARGHARRGRSRRRQMGVGRTTAPAGRGSDTLPGAKRLFLPMRTGRGAIGVVGIDSDKPGPLLTPDERRLLDALIDQSALAIERVNLVEDIERAQAHRRDRPAALGAADLDLARPQDAARRGARRRRHAARPVGPAQRGAEGRPARHHHRRVRAAQPLHRQPARHDAARIRRGRAEHRAARSRARSSAARCERAAQDPRRAIGSRSSSPPTCRCCELDAVLFEQVLFNLLDNAAKYAPPDTTDPHPRLARRRRRSACR